jgi:hypothetical protein
VVGEKPGGGDGGIGHRTGDVVLRGHRDHPRGAGRADLQGDQRPGRALQPLQRVHAVRGVLRCGGNLVGGNLVGGSRTGRQPWHGQRENERGSRHRTVPGATAAPRNALSSTAIAARCGSGTRTEGGSAGRARVAGAPIRRAPTTVPGTNRTTRHETYPAASEAPYLALLGIPTHNRGADEPMYSKPGKLTRHIYRKVRNRQNRARARAVVATVERTE